MYYILVGVIAFVAGVAVGYVDAAKLKIDLADAQAEVTKLRAKISGTP